MDVLTTLTIQLDCSFAKQTAQFKETIIKTEGETDEQFLQRAAVILEVLRHRSK